MEALTNQEHAKLLYTTTPMTFSEVSGKLGLPMRSLMRWSSNDGGWRKEAGPELERQVQEKANALATQKAERDAELTEQAHELAVDLRVGVIDRHRKELQAIRGLLVEAIQSRDISKARFAKTAAQTLEIVQRSERKSWGLDAVEASTEQTCIVIERY